MKRSVPALVVALLVLVAVFTWPITTPGGLLPGVKPGSYDYAYGAAALLGIAAASALADGLHALAAAISRYRSRARIHAQHSRMTTVS